MRKTNLLGSRPKKRAMADVTLYFEASVLVAGDFLFMRKYIYELRDEILRAHRIGQAVKIEGLGTFTPTIRLDGSLDILFRPDPDMLKRLNNRTKFHAKILNKANFGKSAEELVAQWNVEYSDDLVEG
jgi:hypothetical protein